MTRLALCAALIGFACAAEAAPYALVDGNGVTVNIIEWDGSAKYTAPKGMTLVPAEKTAPMAAVPQVQSSCDPGSVKTDGMTLIVCAPTGELKKVQMPAEVTQEAKP